MAKHRILYIDDHPQTFDVGKYLGQEEFCLLECKNEIEYKKHLMTSEPFHGAIVDYKLDAPFTSYKDGVELTRELRLNFPDIAIVAVSRYMAPTAQLQEILKWQVAGANYFWQKGPKQFDQETLEQVRQILRFGAHQVERWNTLLAGQIDPRDFPEFTKTTIPLKRIAMLPSPVLITGETGTGKESVARMIHSLSRRSQRPLVTINCSAIPGTLLESELFGYEKGAFTGATVSKEGKLEFARGGTVFLDEIGELPYDQQPKILRVIQEQEIQRLGSSQSAKVDVRIIAATNRNLASMVKEKKFREDLYYRLNVFPICVQPLRDRPCDFPEIVTKLVKVWNQKFRNDPEIELTADAIEYLKPTNEQPYAGNIRELENRIQRIVGLAQKPRLNGGDIANIEAYYVSPSVSDLFTASPIRRPIAGNDQYVDLMANILDTLIPNIGSSLDLKSENSVISSAHEILLKSYDVNKTFSHRYLLELVATRRPQTAEALSAALKRLKGSRSRPGTLSRKRTA